MFKIIIQSCHIYSGNFTSPYLIYEAIWSAEATDQSSAPFLVHVSAHMSLHVGATWELLLPFVQVLKQSS